MPERYTSGTKIPKKPRMCTTSTNTSMVGSAPLMKMLINTQSSKTAHSSSVVCQPSRWKPPSASFKLTSCRTRSETKKHVDVNAAIHPITVSQPTVISFGTTCFGILRTSNVAAKFLVGSRRKQRYLTLSTLSSVCYESWEAYPVVLASSRGHCACKLSNADEDGEIS